MDHEILIRPDQDIGETLPMLSSSPQSLGVLTQERKQTYLKITLFESSITKAIDKQKLKIPTATAIDSWDEQLTYADLTQRSDKLAAYLTSHGLFHGHVVPICFEKSASAIVTMLAVLKLGAAFVPLDPHYPQSRFSEILSQCSAKIVLADPQSTGRVPFSNVLTVKSSETSIVAPLGSVRRQYQDGKSLAYVIFTSGSSGKPKGVLISHNALYTSLSEHGGRLGLNSSSRALQFTSYTFDPCFTEILSVLMYGGCVCVPDSESRLNDLSGCFNRFNVNWAFLTPSVSRLLDPDNVPTLQTLALGGEAVTQDCIDRWATRVELYNAYGPTECTIFASVGPLTIESNPRNIGREVGGKNWIVNQDDPHELVSTGQIGELLVEGPILANGYLHDPERTATAFIQDLRWAISSQAHGHRRRFYKTGDLVYGEPDGTIVYVGRKDSQVKLRGQRVDLQEIEYLIQQAFPRVQSAADVLELDTFTQVLVVFICYMQHTSRLELEQKMGLDTSASFDQLVTNINAKLQTMLPSYMMPAHYIHVRRIPYSVSGKTDRKFLNAYGMEYLSRRRKETYQESHDKPVPATSNEKILQAAWSEVLKISQENINSQSNFFALGGNSISAIYLIKLLRDRGLSVSLASINSHPILHDLSKSLAAGDPSIAISRSQPFAVVEKDPSLSRDNLCRETARICNVKPYQIEDMYPATPMQEGLLSVSLGSTGEYMGYYVFRVSEGTDEERLRRAWAVVIKECPIFRTRFVYVSDGRLFQTVINEEPHWRIERNLKKFLASCSTFEVKLGKPLAHLAHIRAPADEQYLVLHIHHALYDGWSLLEAIQRVSAFYQGTPSSISRPFRDFVGHLSALDDESARSFWASYLETHQYSAFPELPTDHLQPKPSSHVSIRVKHEKETQLRSGTTHLIQAAWAIVVGQKTHSSDVVFGTTFSGRDTPLSQVESVAGPTIATVPLRISVHQNQTIQNLLDAMRDDRTAMLPHQHLGIQKIQQLGDGPKNACKFQTLLVVQPEALRIQSETKEPGSSPLRLLNSDEMVETYNLILEVFVGESGITMNARFDEQCLSSRLMESLLDQWKHVFHQLSTADPNTELSSIHVIGLVDLKIIQTWNGYVPLVENVLFHQKVAQLAIEKPNAPSISSWDMNLTYRDLDCLSSRMAGDLILAGVTSGSVVPICLERSGLTILAILSVIKAGATFILMDCAQPHARLLAVLQESRAKRIVTSPHQADIWPIAAIVIDKEILQSSSADQSLPDVTPDSAAYIQYTSGSTGQPKGVMVEHGAIATSLNGLGLRLELNHDSRSLQFASYAFDASLLEIMTTLYHGGCVCVPTEEARSNNVIDYMQKERINWAFFTPSFIRVVNPDECPLLRTVVVGGEAINPECVSRWAGRLHLINAFGPAETSIVCSTCPVPANAPYAFISIGTGVSCATWIVDQENHRRILPIGDIGELVVEGPILARGYFQDEEKTKASFITCEAFHPARPVSRLYKTGDLVQYNGDGSLIYRGRKDDQVKIRGQRLELAEVEHHILSHVGIRQVAALVPQAGTLASRLVGVIALSDTVSAQETASNKCLLPLQGQRKKNAQALIDSLSQKLAHGIPSFMVPSSWVAVEQIPLTLSGKLDRRRMKQWVETFDADIALYVIPCVQRPIKQELFINPSSPRELLLRDVWARVLNVPRDQISSTSTFHELGGDSITAMQSLLECRRLGFSIQLQDLMRRRGSLGHLAALEVSNETRPVAIQTEVHEEKFSLSPIQRLYFQFAPEHSSWFNQSLLLAVRSNIDVYSLRNALQALIERHSMLRARFQFHGGSWSQIIPQYSSPVHVSFHEIDHYEEMAAVTQLTQRLLNAVNGPVFVANIFCLPDGQQKLFLCAHHLVVDLVSWRILLEDLECHLTTGHITGLASTPFQVWVKEQIAYSSKLPPATKLLPLPVEPVLWDYWNISQSDLDFGNTMRATISLSAAKTQRIMSQTLFFLGCEIVDVLLTTVAVSFLKTFEDRQLPTVFMEGHGRESWSPELDCTRTVGWFTTLYPLLWRISNKATISNTVRRSYQARKALSRNGFEYFSSHFLGSETNPLMTPCEILFNYEGMYQQLERPDALFRIDSHFEGDKYDISGNMSRLAVIDIVAAIKDNKIHISWSFPATISHQEQIKSWTKNATSVLDEFANFVGYLSERVFGTLPSPRSLSRMYPKLDHLVPASCSQKSMLVAQRTGRPCYVPRLHFQIRSTHATLDLDRLERAWSSVQSRHSILRTIFLANDSEDNFDQLVLHLPDDRTYKKSSVAENQECIGEFLRRCEHTRQPPHELLVTSLSDNEVLCIWTVSHALIDQVSMHTLWRDLSKAYDEISIATPAPQFSSLSSSDAETHTLSRQFWQSYLKNVKPCCIQRQDVSRNSQLRMNVTVPVAFNHDYALHNICTTYGVLPSTIFQLAWAFTLEKYLSRQDILFGVVTSGRELDVDHIDEIVGPVMSILPFRVTSRPDDTDRGLLSRVQANFLDCLPHQRVSFTRIDSTDDGKPKASRCEFDTALNYRANGTRNGIQEDSLTLLVEIKTASDPYNFAAVLEVDKYHDCTQVALTYWTDLVTDSEANMLANLTSLMIKRLLT